MQADCSTLPTALLSINRSEGKMGSHLTNANSYFEPVPLLEAHPAATSSQYLANGPMPPPLPLVS